MHQLLENYITDVAAKLQLLPIKQRNEELKEMRQHLLNVDLVNREMGQAEEESAQTAIVQFGKPEELAASVIQAWHRDIWLKRRDFTGATLCMFLMPSLLIHLITPLIWAFVPHSNPSYIKWNLIYSLVNFGMSGLISGLAFPKRAIAGVGMGYIASVVAFILQFLVAVQHAAPETRHSLLTVNIDRFVSSEAGLDMLALAFVAGLGAWAGSRWRRRKISQSFLSA